MKVMELRSNDSGEYSELIEITAECDGQSASVAGTFFGSKPRIVKVDGRFVEAAPHGILLMLENHDRPGMVGHYGTLLGKHSINIASMSLSRNEQGGTALTILNLDSAPDEKLISLILSDPDILSAKVIKL
jgi:D-3-phosphoglycerate dehydrogenase